jgi:hypothetical protein
MTKPSVIASLTAVGSIMFAADGQGPPVPDPARYSRLLESGSALVDPTASPLLVDRAISDCAPTVEHAWFAPTPHLVRCVGPRNPTFDGLHAQDFRAADVNGDGSIDHFRARPGGGTGAFVIFNGVPINDYAELSVSREIVTESEPGISLQRIRVFSEPSDIIGWCAANLPAPQGGYLLLQIVGGDMAGGWRDMDGDGDLDLLLLASDSSGIIGQIWMENIGYQKPAQPLAADINRDGRVDGADLGLVLVSWGPNP